MDYRANLKNHKRIIVKIGTTSLTYPNGKLNLKKIDRLVLVLADLINSGKEIILVSSGAIAVGADRLGLLTRPRDIMGKQAASAVGQAVLMQIYEKFFMEYNQKAAQILLTKEIIDNEIRRKNARNTLFTLLTMGIVPVVNENDTVSTDELDEFSDNDTLSAYVTLLVEGDLLIILSDIDGLYIEDPKDNPDAAIIPLVKNIDGYIRGLAGDSKTKLGTGGMATKISAAEMVNAMGIDMVIAQGNDPNIIYDILDGIEIGTLFTVEER